MRCGFTTTTRDKRATCWPASIAMCPCSTPARVARPSPSRPARGIGDVLIAWENEALLVAREISPEDFEVVVPSVSILAEPPVAVVDKVVDQRGTRKAAEAYLNFLYTPEGQQLVAKHYYRPRLQEAAEGYPDRFAQLELMHIEDFGGWVKAYKTHFAEGGIFDQIYRPGS